MCGIFGEVRYSAPAGDRKYYDLALSRIRSRGPDFEQIIELPNATLAHARLSLLDIHPRCHQPFFSEDKRFVIVYNGTIYNYRELTIDLKQKGYAFISSGDTEAILHGYREYGALLCEKLDGIFAFAIYDTISHELFLARDRFGIKPLYTQMSKNLFRFSSNLDALLCFPDTNRDLNYQALHHQFTFHGSVPAPHTIFSGIEKLPSASYMLIQENATTSKKRYWQLPIKTFDRTLQEHKALIEDCLESAVKKQISANDVSVAVLLSGGLDSSLLAALMATHTSSALTTYSIGFEDSGNEEGNEFYYSDMVAQHIGSEHHKITIPTSQLLSSLPAVIKAMSEPMFAQDAVGFYLLAQQVANNYKIVLSGQGADEVFAGYSWYQQFYQHPKRSTYDLHYLDRSHEELLSLVSMPNMSNTTVDPSRKLIADAVYASNAEEFFHQALAFDCTSLIIDDPVKRVDTMTMAHGLEARVPFLDHFLVEAAFTVPSKHKLSRNGKGILKNIADDYLPAEVIGRKKGYFPVPPLKFISGSILELVSDTLSSRACRARDLYNQATISYLLENPNQHGRTPIAGNTLWHVTLFELWLQSRGI